MVTDNLSYLIKIMLYYARLMCIRRVFLTAIIANIKGEGMKISKWQMAVLALMVALTGCNKKSTQEIAEEKEVPMTAAPASNAQTTVVQDESEQQPQTDNSSEQATAESEQESEEPVAEVIDYDEKEAATATADAEVEDDEQPQSK